MNTITITTKQTVYQSFEFTYEEFKETVYPDEPDEKARKVWDRMCLKDEIVFEDDDHYFKEYDALYNNIDRIKDTYGDEETEEEKEKEETDDSEDDDPQDESNCCLCGDEFEGYGNNPAPLEGDRCCDACNITKVIPARFERMKITNPYLGK